MRFCPYSKSSYDPGFIIAKMISFNGPASAIEEKWTPSPQNRFGRNAYLFSGGPRSHRQLLNICRENLLGLEGIYNHNLLFS